MVLVFKNDGTSIFGAPRYAIYRHLTTHNRRIYPPLPTTPFFFFPRQSDQQIIDISWRYVSDTPETSKYRRIYYPPLPTAGGALLSKRRGLDRGPPHRLPAVHDPRPPREEGGAGVPRAVELDRASPWGVADKRLSPRDASLQQGPPIRVPG